MGAEDESGPLAGRFRVLRDLGVGITGKVVLADDLHSGERVAVKLLLNPHPHLKERLHREVELLGRYSHPALVPLLAADLEHEPAYLAFPFLPGGDLTASLDAGTPLEAEEVVEIGTRVGEALGYLHERDALHRDVKPHNLLRDAEGRAHLADLGLGVDADAATLTRTGMVVGSLRYLAPEILEGGEMASPAADVYALAVTLGELRLARRADAELGRPPFSPERLAKITPIGLRAALAAGMRTSPEDRPGDGHAFVGLLREALEDRPTFSDDDDLPTRTLEPRPSPPPESASEVVPPAAIATTQQPPVARSRRGLGALGMAAGLGLLALAWPRSPDEPPPPPPVSGEVSPPVGKVARLLVGGALRLDVTAACQVRWRWPPGEPWVELGPGTHTLRLPRDVRADLALDWRIDGTLGTRRWATADLLDWLLAPLESSPPADLRARVAAAPDGEEADLVLRVHEVLAGLAPRVLDSDLRPELRRRILAALGLCEGVIVAGGLSPRATYPSSSSGGSSIQKRAVSPAAARVEALAMGRAGQPPREVPGQAPHHRLKAPHYSQVLVRTSWREIEQVLDFTWPEGSLPAECRRVGVGLVLRGVGLLQTRAVLTGPRSVEVLLGGVDPQLPGDPTEFLVERVVPRDLLPLPGEPVQLRLEMLHPEARSFADVLALELRVR
jgi:serine/threonine protein kinase